MAQTYKVVGPKSVGTGEQDYGKGVCRLHPQRAGELGLKRNAIVKIRNVETGDTLYSVVRFVPGIKHVDKDILVIEFEQRRALSLGRGAEAAELEITRSNFLNSFMYFWNHPDIQFKFASRMSVVLSALSLIIGFLLGTITSLL